jgi:hypothetical protein
VRLEAGAVWTGDDTLRGSRTARALEYVEIVVEESHVGFGLEEENRRGDTASNGRCWFP